MSHRIETAEQMQSFAAHLAGHVRPGDVLELVGDLGAGKTTFTQGFGRALGVSEAITSPTFVISRTHPVDGGPDLVHVDAYRLGTALELDDLDLDTDLAEAVTVVEWGEGLAERLADDWLTIRIERSADAADDTRIVTVEGHGSRWDASALAALEESA